MCWILKLSDKVNIKCDDVNTLVDIIFNQIKEYLINDITIELRGFGTFEER
ncbi:unnamed protein product [marine sediment metagenome]|uniref:Integration host factor subunit beta n=1 Tax=marine sediment metagenome TaxID=412755 RepID=X0WJW1_9ZZZZ